MNHDLTKPAGKALACLLCLLSLIIWMPTSAYAAVDNDGTGADDTDPTERETGLKPNRMLVVNELGQFVPFNLNHVADIRFVNVDAVASCALTLEECSFEKVSISTEVTDEVSSYSVGLMTEEEAERYSRDVDVIEWLQRNSLYDLITAEQNLEIAGEGELVPDKQYRIVAAARDRFGTWDVVTRLDFTALKPEIIGNPEVVLRVEYPTTDSIEICMMPNKDVSAYYFLFGPEGRYQDYLEKHREEGFSSIEQVVIALGTKSTVTITQKWSNLSARFAYELMVVPLDKRGTILPATINKLALP